MSEKRVTKSDVLQIARVFVDVATRAGFDTQHWVIEAPGMAGDHWQLRERNPETGARESTPFSPYLGVGNRAAYVKLVAWIECLAAINHERAREQQP